ncbi:hypothetical protein BGX28_008701 [Mortierella sp. GBA30]|nr:hypothetical protein BGX28_008701 [Mortierella sp. GBA30]
MSRAGSLRKSSSTDQYTTSRDNNGSSAQIQVCDHCYRVRHLGNSNQGRHRSNEIGDEESQDHKARGIIKLIQELFRIGNEVMRCAQQALVCFVCDVIAPNPSVSAVDVEAHKAKFAQFGSFHDNTLTNLLKDIFYWHNGDKNHGGRRSDTPANRCIKDVLESYRRVLNRAGKNVPVN